MNHTEVIEYTTDFWEHLIRLTVDRHGADVP